MSQAHSEALRKRWQNAAYRERQTATNRQTNEGRKQYFADPLARKRHSQAVRIGQRVRKRGRG